MKSAIWKNPKIWLGIFISLVFAWLAVRGVDLAKVMQALEQADYAGVLVYALLIQAVFWLRALRWRVLLEKLAVRSMRTVYGATVVGNMVNYLLPLRVGEISRAYLVGTKAGVSRSSTFATIVVERLVDVVSILAFFVLLMATIDLPPTSDKTRELMNQAALALSVMSILLLTGLFALHHRVDWVIRLLDATLGRITPSIAEQLRWRIASFADGIPPTQDWIGLAKIAVYTLVIWLVSAASIWVLLDSFHFDLPFEAACLVLVALSFGVSMPSAPGFIGTFHYAAILALLLYGIGQSDGLSFALVLHAAMVVPTILVGSWFLWSDGLSWRRLTAVEQ